MTSDLIIHPGFHFTTLLFYNNVFENQYSNINYVTHKTNFHQRAFTIKRDHGRLFTHHKERYPFMSQAVLP